MADESGEDGQVERCILDLTARSLDGKPAGSVAMVSDGCAFKKMPFWWMVRVHGWRIAFRQVYRDWKTRNPDVR